MRRSLLLLLLCAGCGRSGLVHYSSLPGEPPDAGKELVPCMTGELTPRPVVPAVMLVVDRSGSMDFDLAGNAGPPFGNPLTGPTRWAVLRASLESTLSHFDQQIAFGMVMFPGDDFCGAPSAIELQPRAGNATQVLARFNRVPEGGTPTFGAVNAAGDLLVSVHGQAQVLITDGDPNCNSALDPDTCDCTAPRVGVPPVCSEATACRDGDRAIDGIRRLRQDRGITTYVVGVGSSTSTVLHTLDNMAIAGGAPRTGGSHTFYSGATQASLTEALEAISTRLSHCTWATGTRLGPTDLVTVMVGADVVPSQVTDGWSWVDQTSGDFVLQGSWCTRAAAGEPVLVRLECR